VTEGRPVRSPFDNTAAPRAVLAQANAIGLVGFAVLGLFTAVTPSFLDRLGQHAPISTGLVVFSVFAASALGQLFTRRLRPRTTLMAGVATCSVGAATVGTSLHLPSIPVLVTPVPTIGSYRTRSRRRKVIHSHRRSHREPVLRMAL
jgi:Na+/melibiose symporter-like transporter